MLFVAVIAAIFGYAGRYGSAAWVAAVLPKVLLLIFLVFFVLTLAKHLARSTS